MRSDRGREERSGADQGESDAESEGWNVGSNRDSSEEMEEDSIPEEEQGGIGDTLTASPCGTQESGAGGLQVVAQAGRSDNRKAPLVAADKAGTQGRHGARQGQGKKTEAGGKWWEQSPRE